MITRRTLVNIVAFLAVSALLVLTGVNRFILTASGGRSITVDFTDATGVAPRNDVTMRGVPVGIVRTVRLTPTGLAEVTVQLDPGQTVPSLRAQGARFEARLAGLRGEDDRVEPSFAAATSAFQELGVPFAAAVSQLEHAEWLIGQGRAAKAGDLLAAARTTFERLGARPWLERVDRLEPRPVEAVVGG